MFHVGQAIVTHEGARGTVAFVDNEHKHLLLEAKHGELWVLWREVKSVDGVPIEKVEADRG